MTMAGLYDAIGMALATILGMAAIIGAAAFVVMEATGRLPRKFTFPVTKPPPPRLMPGLSCACTRCERCDEIERLRADRDHLAEHIRLMIGEARPGVSNAVVDQDAPP